MKANELSCKDLMVDDWIRIKITQHNTTVTNIDANSIYTEAAFPIRYDEIEPIPLIAEILEKNGFIKQNFDGWEYIHPDGSTFSYVGYRILWRTDYDNHLFIKKYKGNNTSATLQISNINYVHQLLHALRLCGIEKEIIL